MDTQTLPHVKFTKYIPKGEKKFYSLLPYEKTEGRKIIEQGVIIKPSFNYQGLSIGSFPSEFLIDEEIQTNFEIRRQDNAILLISKH